jgi:hypothetical protein
MMETILRGNMRVSSLGVTITMLCATLVVATAWSAGIDWLRYLSVPIGAVILLAAVWRATRPCLAYDNGKLLVFLHPLGPYRVPIDYVEVFFLGQGPVPGFRTPPTDSTREPPVAANVVVRLAEGAKGWHQRDTENTAVGSWQDGYITVRGLWCEPLNADVIRRMNHRLVEIKRTRKDRSDKAVG